MIINGQDSNFLMVMMKEFLRMKKIGNVMEVYRFYHLENIESIRGREGILRSLFLGFVELE